VALPRRQIVPLAREGYDLAMRPTHAPPETHIAWALCATRSVLAASRAYLRRRGTPVEPGNLARHDCLHSLRPGDAPAWRLTPLQATADPMPKVTVPIGDPFAASNSEALREVALAGLGIALLPDFSAHAALRAGKLVQVLPGWHPVGSLTRFAPTARMCRGRRRRFWRICARGCRLELGREDRSLCLGRRWPGRGRGTPQNVPHEHAPGDRALHRAPPRLAGQALPDPTAPPLRHPSWPAARRNLASNQSPQS
jgi:DNA-binding transcriptional LysR family regulator